MAEHEAKKTIQIYPSPTSSSARLVTAFWREKYERDAKRYWDVFYRRHQDRFFKDRHYLNKEWGSYFQGREGEKLVVLEVGCGAGNTIFPLMSTYPDVFVHACDFSPRAIDLVKRHKDFTTDQVHAFVCDLTTDDLSKIIEPSSVDIVTMVFVLSAVSPEKMPLVLLNIKKVLKQNGHVLFRDYAIGDLAQERLTSKEQKISENFFVRGDGTRAFYFSEVFLTDLFTKSGFDLDEIGIHNKKVENRSLELVMNRRWIQAVYTIKPSNSQRSTNKLNLINQEIIEPEPSSNVTSEGGNDPEIDLSEDICSMFGMSPTINEAIEIKANDYTFKIKALPKENQHTCKSTGLMVWESARFMCNLLAENPSSVAGKRVLELGCGSAGVCSMVAVHFAHQVVATDGDLEALDLLKQNIESNLEPNLIEKMIIKRLIWGNTDDIIAVKEICGREAGFDVIIGTDVTYNFDAISPLFRTARELIAKEDSEGGSKPALILCHIQRRVDECSIVESANQFGFRLADKWLNGVHPSCGIIGSWFSGNFISESAFRNAPLTVLYFGA
ncbi:uncharacterized protein LOC109714456 isoform X1 [Ananas comosus]|uniref:Uncharacterized protein LOC109714456 isoform X1 n=2 Tax=Ananas comosus TaxID=4615 RepID=A0A6P5FFE5_ANACO|nr:uncharacterized protein LOC109714456 isoform X1 [Ananas comosus]